jgi:ferric-dicitrate binding protein FerR (iron transport regulator)
MRAHNRSRILAFVGFLGPTFLLQAADVVGQLSTDTGATVTARGLAVTLAPRQEYPLFSGDRAQTNSEPGSSVLTLPAAGHITLAADTAVGVERSQGRFLLDVERGQAGFDFVPGAPVFLVAGEQ